MNTNGNAIVLFDGVCNFCNGSVNFVIEHDRAAYFKFAPLQSEVGQKLLGEYKIDKANTDSVVLIENGVASTYSTAALNIAAHLDGAWSALAAFRFVPVFVRDFCYKTFARNRYKLFGKQEACMLPTPEIRARFLG